MRLLLCLNNIIRTYKTQIKLSPQGQNESACSPWVVFLSENRKVRYRGLAKCFLNIFFKRTVHNLLLNPLTCPATLRLNSIFPSLSHHLVSSLTAFYHHTHRFNVLDIDKNKKINVLVITCNDWQRLFGNAVNTANDVSVGCIRLKTILENACR